MKQENTLGPPVTKGRGPKEKDQPPPIHNQEGNTYIEHDNGFGRVLGLQAMITMLKTQIFP